jgi:hypothetical protein
MSWQSELTIMVRTLIDDFGDVPVYSDSRIEKCLIVSAKYVQFDVVLEHSYDVNVETSTITPDPTIDNDEIFIMLTALKAACLVDQGTLRTKVAMEGVRASLGPASLSVGGSTSAWEKVLNHGPCKLYSDLIEHWDVANASAIAAVIGPFSGNKFDPELQRNQRSDPFRSGFFS